MAMAEQFDNTPNSQPRFVRQVDDGIELRLKVVPGASRSQIVGILGDRLKIRVAEAPEQGKANRAVIRLLSGWLGVNGIEIISGHGSPEKTARVPGLRGLSVEQLYKMND
jgi:uncharacterized protein (TIGR00251 family)